jgi:hypothetical protein
MRKLEKQWFLALWVGTRKEIEDRRSGESTEPLRRDVMKEWSASI